MDKPIAQPLSTLYYEVDSKPILATFTTKTILNAAEFAEFLKNNPRTVIDNGIR